MSPCCLSALTAITYKNSISPRQLKHALVTPRLKKPASDPDTASSHRPISNLSFISKLVERLVAKRLTSHVNQHTLLPAQQSAYRPFHSTVDDCRVSQLVLLDLSAAFDTVDHQVLQCVLSDCFGISGTSLNWFESYLSDRTQPFVQTGHTTAYFPVTCSVPQGSVFGPLSFIAYTDDSRTIGRSGLTSLSLGRIS